MAIVELNERLYDSLPVEEVGNAAFGMWVRCLIRGAEQEFPGYVISEAMAIRLGSRALLKKLVTPLNLPPYTNALLEVDADLATNEQFSGPTWLRPVNWEIGDARKLAWTIHRARAAIPEEIRAAVFERDGRRCVRCGATENLTIDHVHPHSKGGPDAISNFQTLCQPCNSRKGNRA